MSLFGRVASVNIGDPGEDGLDLKNMRINFTVNKSLSNASANNAIIKIWNLAQSSRDFIRKNKTIILKAGYTEDTGEKNVFIGTIKRVTITRDGADVITEIESYDGERILNETRVSVSYDLEASAKEAFKDISGLIGVSLPSLDNTILDVPFINGFSFAGPGKKALDSIANRLGIEWSIQDQEIQVLKKDEPNDREVVLISPATGLKGSPSRLSDEGDENINNVEAPEGWQVKSVLAPLLVPGDQVDLQASDPSAQGIFKIENLKHEGDTHGEVWDTMLELKEPV